MANRGHLSRDDVVEKVHKERFTKPRNGNPNSLCGD